MFKNLLLAFGVCGLAVASAKTYTVTLSQPYTVAGRQLRPGDYRLTVNGTKAVLMDRRGKTIDANTTVQNEQKKYSYTAVESNSANGATHLQAIEVAGTNVKVNFN